MVFTLVHQVFHCRNHSVILFLTFDHLDQNAICHAEVLPSVHIRLIGPKKAGEPQREYNRLVARGWESKSVEAQIETANVRQGHPRVKLSPEQIEIERKRDGLLLHRTRVLHDLQSCENVRYRKTLQDGLNYLEGQLADLGWQA